MSAKRFRLTVTLASFLLATVVLSALYIYLPNTYHTIDNRLRDFFFIYRGNAPHSEDIVIVDIDEKSLKILGQWPWERKYIARMLDNLTQAEVGIIGLDIIFSEEDKTSPKNVAKRLGIDNDKLRLIANELKIKESTFEDYDAILSQSVASTPTILGYVFDFERNSSDAIPQIPAIFIEKGYTGNEFMFNPKGVLLNIPIIQEQAYSSGYLNNVPDPSGMVRSVPLVMKYDDSIYPSLAFEMTRIAHEVSKVMVQYNETGINNISMGEFNVPTDRFGRLFVNYKGPAKTYDYISAIDIVRGTFAPQKVAGKLVLVGTSAYGLMDLRATPLDSIMPGVEIHANVIDNILNNEMLHRPDWAEGADLLIIILIAAVILMAVSYIPLWLGSLFIISLVYGTFVGYYTLLFEYYIILNIVFPMLTLALSIFMMLGIKYFFEVRQKEMIKGKFSQKVSPQVMEDLISQGTTDYLSTKNENVTIFFSDIRSFTTISESLESPERLVSFLNYYMTEMAETIITRDGTIDKFIGDAIMAYWNAPNRVLNHADYAVQASLEQIAKRDSLNIYIKQEYGFELDFGIGLNTGQVTIGDIGSEGRSDYTVIGDPVNLAARLEGLCKYYGVRLIISEFTKAELVHEYVFRELDWVKVKGKTEPVKIYEVLEQSKEPQNPEYFSTYHNALRLFRLSQFEKALAMFEQLNTQDAHKVHKLYIDRCHYLIKNKTDDFDGIFEFEFK